MYYKIRTILYSTLVAGALTLSLTYTSASHAADSTLARANTAANVRQAPSTDAARVTVLQEGQQVRIVGTAGTGQSWHQVADMRGEVLGFVAARLLDPVEDASGSVFARQMAMVQGDASTTRSSRPAATGSIFEQAVTSGAIDSAHDENRRREAERQRQAVEQQRLDFEKWQRQYAEQRRLDDEIADERAREIEERNRRLRERNSGNDNSMAAAAIQRMQSGFNLDIQRQQQALLDLQRQQQTQQPSRHDGSRRQQTTPPSRPAASTQPRSMPREQPQRGCWAAPDPGKSSCVRSDGQWGRGMNSDRFIVTHENICSERIVVRMCNERTSGAPLCGQGNIAPGQSRKWDSFSDSTGGYSVQWVGSRNSTEDWACVSQMGWRN